MSAHWHRNSSLFGVAHAGVNTSAGAHSESQGYHLFIPWSPLLSCELLGSRHDFHPHHALQCGPTADTPPMFVWLACSVRRSPYQYQCSLTQQEVPAQVLVYPAKQRIHRGKLIVDHFRCFIFLPPRGNYQKVILV